MNCRVIIQKMDGFFSHYQMCRKRSSVLLDGESRQNLFLILWHNRVCIKNDGSNCIIAAYYNCLAYSFLLLYTSSTCDWKFGKKEN